MLGHVQAPRQVWHRRLATLQDLQQQAFEADRQLAAETHEQRAWRMLAIGKAGVMAVLVTEVLQRTLPFQ